MVYATADGQRGAQPLGRVPYVVPRNVAPGEYSKLRQWAWTTKMADVGHYGGHRGWTRPRFLDAYVIPLFAPGQPAAQVLIATPASSPGTVSQFGMRR